MRPTAPGRPNISRRSWGTPIRATVRCSSSSIPRESARRARSAARQCRTSPRSDRVPRISSFSLGLLTVGVLAPALVSAHGGVSVENDMCKLRVGPYQMHFTGYQPISAPEVEVCEDIPKTGQTIIVLDYIDEKLRDLPVEVRL